jgi:dolichol-phosphate mannosyltransferase
MNTLPPKAPRVALQFHGRRDRDFTLSIIVPCYNEEEVIRTTFMKLREVALLVTPHFELIFVDDGSKDATFEILREICEGDEHAQCVRLSRNFGHQVAVTAGLEESRGDAAVIIDADLQDPPAVILEMVEKWREGYDVVYGQRQTREGESLFKLGTAFLFYRLINVLSEISIPADTGDFRLIDRRVIDALRMMPERHRLLRGMMSWVGYNQMGVPYVRAPRFAGTSKYPLSKMLGLALDGILSFSIKPLRFVTYIGCGMFCLSVFGIGYALIIRLLTDHWVPGWTLLFIGNLLFSGVEFIILGILGEYVGRIYSEAKARPLYLVASRVGANVFDIPRESAAR